MIKRYALPLDSIKSNSEKVSPLNRRLNADVMNSNWPWKEFWLSWYSIGSECMFRLVGNIERRPLFIWAHPHTSNKPYAFDMRRLKIKTKKKAMWILFCRKTLEWISMKWYSCNDENNYIFDLFNIDRVFDLFAYKPIKLTQQTDKCWNKRRKKKIV